MPSEIVNPSGVHEPIGRSYSHARKAGNTIYVAGQVALDVEGNLVGKGDIVAQTDQVFTNLQAVLAAAGTSFSDVAKLTTYLTSREDLPGFREGRQRHFTGDPPANTLVIVSGLASPDFLLEIEAVAVVD